MATSTKTQLDLSGVSETLLWPLWNRAQEADQVDALIEDPWSRNLVDRIDYDFPGHFGKPTPFHAIRARVGDDLVRAYHRRHGLNGTVIALGEGLDSQRLRTGVPAHQWISVDLAESSAIRRNLLPESEKERMIACSALDPSWISSITPREPPFISAMGLLMYFEEEQVRALLSRIVRAFPGAEIFFDTIPPIFSRRTLRGLQITERYTAPPMPWGIQVTDIPSFLESCGLEPLKVQTYAEPFPQRLRLYWLLGKIRPIRAALAGGLAHAHCRPSA